MSHLVSTEEPVYGDKLNLVVALEQMIRFLLVGEPSTFLPSKKYCLKTAEMCVSKYQLYFMPQSVHEMLIHGSVIFKEFPVPAGTLTEVAQES
ncbi:Pepsin A [Frankliniella fusca]|uniref:Pepsin A n=1 Tax=Frankliniella fusca TaxID=407009 RepID=A0AAE1HL09_9NEOP|nr:Pepsin A [Frankliniella fusca]